MNEIDTAEHFLTELCDSRIESFLGYLEKSHRGISLTLLYLQRSSTQIAAGDIARELHVSSARVAALLKRLEKSGYITRRDAEEDHRRTIVTITDKGREFIAESEEQALRNMETLIREVGEEDLNEFIRISRKIMQALEKSI